MCRVASTNFLRGEVGAGGETTPGGDISPVTVYVPIETERVVRTAVLQGRGEGSVPSGDRFSSSDTE